MKRKLFNVALAAVLVFTGAIAGAVMGRVAPDLLRAPGRLGWPAPAAASALTLEAKAPPAPLTPTGSGFTYQGSLKSGGSPATGSYDFVFTLYDAASAGTSVTVPITLTGQAVSAGLFTVSLDFGSSAFDGNARYMEIAVRQSGGGAYAPLAPRQPLTPAPYALFALKTTPLKNVVTVAQSGGQYTSLQAALASVTDNSAGNRYLVRVGPGTYTETITMKPYVDIEGAGEKTTKITFTGSANLNTGTVVGADNAELRSLTVENTGGDDRAIAICNRFASPSLLHVTAIASGATLGNFGVYGDVSSANMTEVTATASGVAYSNYGIWNGGPSSNMNMTNVIATASGATNINYGVSNFSSSPNMTNVTAGASGAGTYNYGVENINSSPNMINVTASASGSAYSNYGMDNSGSPRIVGSSISAAGGTYNYGISASSASTITIDSSKLSGSTYAIRTGVGTTTQVGASQLSGGPVYGGGSVTCADSYDGSNRRLGGLCTPDTNVLYVALSGGDFSSITDALNSITDNSAANRYLIKVGPGDYFGRVIMKQFVDIEGAGEKATKIFSPGSPGTDTGTVAGARNAELRSLTVENDGGYAYAIGIYNGGLSPSLLHVTVIAGGASVTNYAVFNNVASPNMDDVTANASGSAQYNLGVYNSGSSPNMTGVVATGSGASIGNYGVYNEHASSPNMTGLTAIAASGATFNAGVYDDGSSATIASSAISAVGAAANWGIYHLSGGTVRVDSSKVTANTGTIYNSGTGTITQVGASYLSGGPTSVNGGTLTCAGVYDEGYAFYPGTCPP
jgi:hypothetical protein